jgi:hypothetical protein
MCRRLSRLTVDQATRGPAAPIVDQIAVVNKIIF